MAWSKTVSLPLFLNDNHIEAGIDEAGRGCLAGPVFAAAVILPKDFKVIGLNDSKKLTASKRYEWRLEIERHARAFGVASASVEEIDALNISNAGYLAMHRAIAQLKIQPTHLLVDGKFFKSQTSIPHTCIIKGDSALASIAAASILAKTYRDDYIAQLADQFPEYKWKTNKGYGTLVHREAMAECGLCAHHRKTFMVKVKN